jgi:hypothetical protein
LPTNCGSPAKAIKRFRQRLAGEFRALRGANIAAVLATLVPIVRGWVAYYRTVVSSRVFAALTTYLWKLTYKWACWSHPNKPKHWIVNRYGCGSFGVTVPMGRPRSGRWCRSCVRLIAGLGVIGALVP